MSSININISLPPQPINCGTFQRAVKTKVLQEVWDQRILKDENGDIIKYMGVTEFFLTEPDPKNKKRN